MQKRYSSHKIIILSIIAIFLVSGCDEEDLRNSPTSADIDNAITVPTDVSKIDYPSFYADIGNSKVTVANAYCLINTDYVSYPSYYLGSYPLPEIKGPPLQPTITRAVGIKDFWIEDPNANHCNDLNMSDAYHSTLDRVKAIGAKQIHFTNYVYLTDFNKPEIDSENPAVSDKNLKEIIKYARSQNFDVVLYLNLAPLAPPGKMPNSEWYARLIDEYKPFLINQAKIAQESGAAGIMINHFDYQPSINGYEGIYQSKTVALMKEIRKIYSGKLILLIDPFANSDLTKVSEVIQESDILLYTPTTTPLAGSTDKTISVSNIRSIYLEELKLLGEKYNKYNKPIYLRILIQSEQNFLVNGWVEDAFCIERNNYSCYQGALIPDFSVQAIAYEALMEAIKEAHGKYLNIGAVDSYGYWYTDVILPYNSQPQMAHSIRNKPSESIVRSWFKE